jgi:hypothetical protein
MLSRMRLLKGATALLYIGPLIAGLCGFGWGMVAPFTGIFIVWLMVLRPEQWPASPEEWLTWQAWLAAFAQILSQILLVFCLVAVGRGFGGLADIGTVGINPILPLSVSFMAIPLCRMLWDSHEAASMGFFLDDEAEDAHAENSAGDAATAIIPLLNLPDGETDKTTMAAVAEVMDVAYPGLRLRALAAALANPDRSHASLRRALVLWATEPEVVAPGVVPDSMALGFAIANGDPDLLRLYVPRALALVAAFPNRADGFPDPAKLRHAADEEPAPGSDLPAHLQADLREGLLALARAVETSRVAQPIAHQQGTRPEPASAKAARTA